MQLCCTILHVYLIINLYTIIFVYYSDDDDDDDDDDYSFINIRI